MNRSRYKKYIASIKGWIETKLLLVIGVTLGVAFLISNGPLLQQTLVALFDISQQSVYESIFLAELHWIAVRGGGYSRRLKQDG